jgi:hypothetical protein
MIFSFSAIDIETPLLNALKGAEICRSFSENTDDVKWTQAPKEARQIKTSVVRTAPFRRRRFGHVCPISYEKLYLFNRRLPGRGKIQVK